MIRQKLNLALAGLVVTAAMLLSPAAKANSITLTINPSTVYVSAGGTVSVSATATASSSNTASVYLNGDSFNIGSPLLLNDSAFFTNAPFTLAPSASFTNILFTITAPGGTALGTYTGFFQILGGVLPTSGDALSNAAPFNVVVTPEPASVLLLATGLAGFVARRLYRA